jgi:hypothetical protein
MSVRRSILSRDTSLTAWAGIAGIAIPMVGLVIMPIWSFPNSTATAPQIAAFVAQHRSHLQVMMVLYTVGVTLWLVFGTTLARRMRASVPAQSVLPDLVAAGTIGLVALLLAGFTAFDLLVYKSRGAEASLLYDLSFGLLAMSGLPTAVALLAYAVAIRRYQCVRNSTGYLAEVGAAAHLLLLISFIATAGFFSLEGLVIAVVPATLWLWIFHTGMVVARVDSRTVAAAPAS